MKATHPKSFYPIFPKPKEPPMGIVSLEYAKDEAAAKLDAIEGAESHCLESMHIFLHTLQSACGCSDVDRLNALAEIRAALEGMTDKARLDLSRTISGIEEEIGELEWKDMQRNRPVVI